MLMILSLSVVYAAPGPCPLPDYGPSRTMPSPGTMPPSGLWPPAGLWPPPEYGLHRDKAKSSPCK